MRFLAIMAAAAAALSVACHPFELEPLGKGRPGNRGGTSDRRETGQTGSSEQEGPGGRTEGPTVRPDTVVYLTGVEYPEGYDWGRDTAYGAVSSTLVVFRNGQRWREVPAGLSGAPDRHRFVDGHLYADHTTDTETVLLRDGEELFRYPGTEALRGFLVREGRVHTLGQDCGGKGFSYRIDGEAVFSRPVGEVLGDLGDGAYRSGALYEDEGHVCFAFRDTEYRMVCDGTSQAVSLPADVEEVFDLRMVGGQCYCTLRRRGSAVQPDLYVEGRRFSLGANQGGKAARLCRIVPHGENVMVKGYYETAGTVRQYVLWNMSQVERSYPQNLRIYDFYLSEDTCAFVGTSLSDGKTVLYPGEGVQRIMEGQYRFLSPSCATLYGGKFYAALTGTGTTGNILWADGAVRAVPLRGPLTGVYVYAEQPSDQ